MRPTVTVLVSGAGSPALGVGVLARLREATAFSARAVAIDATGAPAARRFADREVAVPHGTDPRYPEAIQTLVEREGVDVILPLTDDEILPLLEVGRHTATPVAAPPPDASGVALDKASLLDALADPAMPLSVARAPAELSAAAREVGYPGRDVVVKPCRGTGARGVWILSADADGGNVLFARSAVPAITLEQFLALAPEAFAPVLMMPRLIGVEYTVTCLAVGAGRRTIPVRRDGFLPGVTTAGTFDRNTDVIDACERAVERLRLTPICNVQLIHDGDVPRIFEVNPRMSTTSTACMAAGVNVPEALVADALGLKADLGEVAWGTRFVRYHAEVAWTDAP